MFQLGAGTVAVLAPTNAMAEKAAQELVARGMRAVYMHGRKVDLRTGEVKVMTIHSAKGLEFPIVVVVGLEEGILPMVPGDATGDERREYLQAQARLLFVAMTRAMRGLLVLYSAARPSPFVKLLEPRWWAQEKGAR
ncbi:3'-5' exonuclease [Carboxydochorda subterranea]|uniref:3'-5' exonuclease n=1 Tax=Carboxydichorda subterranea TaxID=3109565 RepID=A0ABZ1BU45_9FIRM|nr:3'-5' exonuclease [Limnochorda sp. L945t]WRP16199.1 3'-5' exonuclease [Limnochorda sp. L945t]